MLEDHEPVNMLYTVGCIVLGAAFLLWVMIRIPSDMPKNIPSVPIYVSIIGLWSDMGQDEIYDKWLRRPLEKYGAVKIFFAGRWNVLVTRPDLLTDMFRNDNVYAKAGSQKKIPWSVIATLVGDNIINSHGDDWKLYTSIMKPGLQKQDFKIEPIINKSKTFVSMLLSQQKEIGLGSGVLVNHLIQRWAIAIMGESFLDIDFGCLENSDQRIEVLQTIIKRTLFHPLFFNFPLLDKFPWLFRSRKTAFAIMHEFEDLLVELIENRPRRNEFDPSEDKQSGDLVVHMLERAHRDGTITDTQFRSNLKIVFLTAHENAQQLLNSVFWELGTNQIVQDRLRDEVLARDVAYPTADILNDMPYLTAVIYEMLRLYPPVSQLINRVTVSPSVLAGQIKIPQRVWVGWNAYGVQINEHVWGDDARVFAPERWGDGMKEIQAKYRKEQVKGNYIPFNAHTRRCLGSGFALLQMKVVLFELVRRTKWTIDPTYKFKLTSGGILAPLGCKVIFEELKSQAP